MTSRFRVGWIAAVLCGVAATCASAAAPARLERIVVLQRHGVRAPAPSADRLFRKFGYVPMPWPVPPGELSPHGAAAMQLMGAYLRAVYAADGLLPATGCPAPDTLFVWADNAYERTRDSGDALAAGMFPDCGITAHHAPLGTPDPLFATPKFKSCPVDPVAVQAAILAEAGGSLASLRPRYADALDALQKRIDPDACKPSRISGACLADAPDRLATRANGVRLEGALADGAAMAESLFLSYAQGQSGLTAAEVEAIMPLHELFARILRRPRYNAARGAGPLLRAMLAAIAGKPEPGVDAAAQAPPAARDVTFLGHDVDLSHVAALLGVDWDLPGEPDKTAPDTALVFEVWGAPETPPYVRLRLHYQTLDQLRTLKPLDASARANRIDLTIPGCSDGPDGACPVTGLSALLAEKIDAACAPQQAVPALNPVGK